MNGRFIIYIWSRRALRVTWVMTNIISKKVADLGNRFCINNYFGEILGKEKSPSRYIYEPIEDL